MSRWETPDRALFRARALMEREQRRNQQLSQAYQAFARTKRELEVTRRQPRTFGPGPQRLTTSAQAEQQSLLEKYRAGGPGGGQFYQMSPEDQRRFDELTTEIEGAPASAEPGSRSLFGRLTAPENVATLPLGFSGVGRVGLTQGLVTAGGLLGGQAAGGLAEEETGIPGLEFAGAIAGPGLTARGIGASQKLLPEIGRAITLPRKGPKPAQVIDPTVGKLTNLIKTAKPARAALTKAQQIERSRRAGEAETELTTALERGATAEEAFGQASGRLTGELAPSRFEAVAGLGPAEINQLRTTAAVHPELRFFEKLRTNAALTKVLSGSIPQPNELELLERVYGPKLVSALRGKRPFHVKAATFAGELALLPFATLTTGDVSFTARQGAPFMTRFPKEFGDSFAAQTRALVSEDAARQANSALRTLPHYDRLSRWGLYEAPLTGAAVNPDEAVLSGLVQRSFLTRPFTRAYVTMGNQLRTRSASNLVSSWEQGGRTVTEAEGTALADLMNVASGRGNLGPLSKYAPILNIPFFAPRFAVSRAQFVGILLNPATPRRVRQEAARMLVQWTGSNVALLTMGKLSGTWDVELNPNSPNWGRIRVGDQTLDLWGGMQGYARVVSNLVTGRYKGAATGRESPIDPVTSVERFLRGRLSPLGGITADILAGETGIGEPLPRDEKELGNYVIDRLVPFAANDIMEAIEREGLAGGVVAAPGVLGVGVQNVAPSIRQQLNAIGEYKGLSADEEGQVRDFYRKVDQWRNEQEEEFGEADFSYDRSIERVAERENFDPTLTEWAKVLKSGTLTARNRNPDYDEFILSHWDEVKRDAEHLITDRLRKLHAKGK